MNRAAIFKKLETDRAAAERKTEAALAEYRAAQARYAEWRKPELDLVAAKAALDGAQARLDRVVDDGEVQLRLDALPYLSSARTRLHEEQQDTRRLLDAGGGATNAPAVHARLSALQSAIDKLDRLAISGENDLPPLVRRIMAIFADFEVDERYDMEIQPPAPQRSEPFTVVL